MQYLDIVIWKDVFALFLEKYNNTERLNTVETNLSPGVANRNPAALWGAKVKIYAG